jgi:hypothetical protein
VRTTKENSPHAIFEKNLTEDLISNWQQGPLVHLEVGLHQITHTGTIGGVEPSTKELILSLDEVKDLGRYLGGDVFGAASNHDGILPKGDHICARHCDQTWSAVTLCTEKKPPQESPIQVANYPSNAPDHAPSA